MLQLVKRYYPIFINVYTIWVLYLLFFLSSRADFGQNYYFVRAKPFESIHYVLFEAPFITIEIYKNILGNIVVFIPYGFLGMLYPKLNFYKYLFLVFFIVINILEFSQYYFNRGYAEFDDVMLNTFGMTIGYIIYKKLFFAKDK